MTGCRNPAHYPNREAMLSDDMHLHCAGRVELVDGRTVVVGATKCVQAAYGEPGYKSDFERFLEEATPCELSKERRQLPQDDRSAAEDGISR